ncbi:POTRA domain, ShlB-type [Providencia rettgeri]|uniref:POTRA domain, ShlB-type n=1 Tax=Providencia rettgeri TaxID=587 RepID=A0A379FKQ6_PRORE|nr:POTRA domain, ShlB-type [Providencia rettgeri]
MKANNVLSIYLYFFFWAFMPNKAYSHAITPVTAITQTLPTCIIINQVYLIDAQQLTEISSRHIDGWRKKLEGKCISEQGLLDYADYIRAELIKAGYLTSYLYYPEQTFSVWYPASKNNSRNRFFGGLSK